MSTDVILKLLRDSPQLRQVRQALEEGPGIQIEGLAVAAKSVVVTALRQELNRPIVLVTYNYEQAEHPQGNEACRLSQLLTRTDTGELDAFALGDKRH